MKKLYGLFLVLACFLLVGCGDKKTSVTDFTGEEVKQKDVVLVCSKDSEDPIHFTTEMTFYFEKDMTSKLGIRYIYDLSSYTDAQRQAFASAVLCDTPEFETSLGMKECKEGLEGTNYVVSGYAEKLLAQSRGTSAYVQKSLESDSWTCVTK